ncbi:MAG: guanylate kinase [Acidimicrobiales bacterium]|nr:guanylate kinase [Acidimicrobiales bacterium]
MAEAAEDRSVTFVLSGPGGVGKGTVVERLLNLVDGLWLSRSWTTRDPRPGEAADAYNFVDRETFKAHIEDDGFLEWVEFLDYLQGTPVPNPPSGKDVLLEIDVQGAAQIYAMDPSAVLLFLDAPSIDEQEARLRARGDTEERVAQRLTTAIAERAAAEELGCQVVINDDLDSTVAELAAIIDFCRGERSSVAT